MRAGRPLPGSGEGAPPRRYRSVHRLRGWRRRARRGFAGQAVALQEALHRGRVELQPLGGERVAQPVHGKPRPPRQDAQDARALRLDRRAAAAPPVGAHMAALAKPLHPRRRRCSPAGRTAAPPRLCSCPHAARPPPPPPAGPRSPPGPAASPAIRPSIRPSPRLLLCRFHRREPPVSPEFHRHARPSGRTSPAGRRGPRSAVLIPSERVLRKGGASRRRSVRSWPRSVCFLSDLGYIENKRPGVKPVGAVSSPVMPPYRHARTCSGHPPPPLPPHGRMDTRNKSGYDGGGALFDRLLRYAAARRAALTGEGAPAQTGGQRQRGRRPAAHEP